MDEHPIVVLGHSVEGFHLAINLVSCVAFLCLFLIAGAFFEVNLNLSILKNLKNLLCRLAFCSSATQLLEGLLILFNLEL